MKLFHLLVFAVFGLGIFVESAPAVHNPPNEPWFEQVLNTGAYNMGVTQDREGFLWLTTTGGLIRYDGYEQYIFSEGPGGLTSNFVTSVFEDSEGLLWIVTLSGLDLYDKNDGTISHFQPDRHVPGSIGSNAFNWAPKLVAEDRDGRIWIGSREGLYRYDKKSKSFTPFVSKPFNDDSISSDAVWTVVCDRDGKIWIGTAAGLDVFDPGTSSFSHFRHDPDQPNSLGKGLVYAVLQDKDGEIWVGTSEGGLSRLIADDGTFKTYVHDPADKSTIARNEVFSIMEDRTGVLWLGRSFSSNIGLERFYKQAGTFELFTSNPKKKGTLSGNIVLSCFEDKSGILWVPDNIGPVNKADPFSHRFNLHRQDPDIQGTEGLIGLASVYEDRRGDIWLGGQSGLSRLDRTSQRWNTYPVDPSNPEALWNKYAFSVIEDSDGNFWVATDDGYLNLFDRDRGVVLARYLNPFVQNTARHIIEDRSNPELFWFGVEGYGLFSFNRKTTTYSHYPSQPKNPDALGNEYVYTLVQDRQNIIWAQTQGGLHRFNPQTGKFQRYLHDPDDPQSISGNVINDIFIDSRENFWVSTDRGLNRFSPETGSFERFSRQHGFTTEVIRAIEEDSQGFLWLGSNEGLFAFDPKREMVVRHYTVADGLQSDSFSLYGCSALKSSDGKLWFVGLSGANSFSPEKIFHNDTPPDVYLINLAQGGEELVSKRRVGRAQRIDLGWRHNYFEFEYVGLNFSQATKNQYKYKLEGWDNDWYFAGNKRYGRYSGLSGGLYTLKVMAANNDGIWSTAPATLMVHVDTPFWTAWWFYTIIVFCIAGISGLFTFTRISQLKKFNKELETAYRGVGEAEKKYRSIFENAIEGIFQISPRGQIVSVNPAAATIMGFDSAEEMQREIVHIRQWLHITERKWHEILILLRRQNSVSNYELQVRRKNSELIWLTINIRVINDDTGKMLYADGIMVDITVRKNADEQLRLYQEHLEQLVDERTREYQEINANLQKEIEYRERVEDELLRSRKLESIGVLAGGIAHDFNNLMTIIMGNINLVQIIHGLDESKELENAIHALYRAKDLTQKFITFSSGGEPIKKIHSIEAVTRSAVALALSGSNIQAKLTVAPQVWQVNIDAGYISQAMYNILENSKNAMPEGGTIQVNLHNLPRHDSSRLNEFPIEDNDYVVIEFQDEGPGIPPEHLPKIFDPYFTTAEMGADKGKGLGLTIAYSIVKKHGGYTFVDSTVGRGTTVRLLLPAIAAAADPAVQPVIAPLLPTRKKKILLMDDEEMLRDMVGMMLAKLGYEVSLAADGNSAVTQFKQALLAGSPPDAVILDLTIPGGIGGKEVAKILSRLVPDLKAVVSSGYSDDPVVANYREYGFVASLSKPYDMEALRTRLEQVVGTGS